MGLDFMGGGGPITLSADTSTSMGSSASSGDLLAQVSSAHALAPPPPYHLLSFCFACKSLACLMLCPGSRIPPRARSPASSLCVCAEPCGIRPGWCGCRAAGAGGGRDSSKRRPGSGGQRCATARLCTAAGGPLSGFGFHAVPLAANTVGVSQHAPSWHASRTPHSITYSCKKKLYW